MSDTVTVTVAGDEVEVQRPPFRRLKPLLPLVVGLDSDEGRVDLDPATMVEVGEVLAGVLFGDAADEHLDRLYTPAEFIEFLSSAMAALQLGEAGASTGS